jgi:hypothetical protein
VKHAGNGWTKWYNLTLSMNPTIPLINKTLVNDEELINKGKLFYEFNVHFAN